MGQNNKLAPVSIISESAIAISDIGQKRHINEDNVLIDEDLGFYIVADGMGGHKGGELASDLAVKTMHKAIKKDQSQDDLTPDSIKTILKNAIYSSNQKINEQNIAQGISEGHGMGTTITGFWYPVQSKSHQLIFGFNLGDSRFYSFYQGELKQLSSDHSHHQLWIETGKVDKEPKKNLIYKALGPWKKVLPDQFTHILKKNELLLLCSDGLSDMLEDKVICAILNKYKDNSIQETAQALISIANKAGGKDNISVLLYKN